MVAKYCKIDKNIYVNGRPRVKAATAVGWNDMFTHWWCTNGEMAHRSLQYIGAFPMMYGGGQNTFVA